MATPTAPRPRVKPARCFHLSRARGGTAVLRLSVGKVEVDYLVSEHGCDVDDDSARLFELTKLSAGGDPDEQRYYVLIGEGPHRNCACKGFARHDHCKHEAGLRLFVELGRI